MNRPAPKKALLPLEPYGRGLVLSRAADHYLQRAFDAEEAVLCFGRHWSFVLNGPILVQERTPRAASAAQFTQKNATQDNPNSVRFVRFHVEMFHEQLAVVDGHLLVVSLRDGIRRSLCATFEHLGFLAEYRKVRHRYLLVEAAEGSHVVRDSFQVGLMI
jgi:hypothetical protein